MYCIKYILFIHTYIKSNNLLDEVAKPDVIEYDIVSINTQVNIAQQSQVYLFSIPKIYIFDTGGALLD